MTKTTTEQTETKMKDYKYFSITNIQPDYDYMGVGGKDDFSYTNGRETLLKGGKMYVPTDLCKENEYQLMSWCLPHWFYEMLENKKYDDSNVIGALFEDFHEILLDTFGIFQEDGFDCDFYTEDEWEEIQTSHAFTKTNGKPTDKMSIA
jgi:hypothetical protein